MAGSRLILRMRNFFLGSCLHMVTLYMALELRFLNALAFLKLTIMRLLRSMLYGTRRIVI